MTEKVGLLTFHWAPHIGAYLQTYALYNILRSLRFNVTVINFLPKFYTIVKPTVNLSDLLLKHHYITSRNKSLFDTTRGIIGEILTQPFYFGAQRRKKVVYETYLALVKLSKRVSSLNELRDVVNDLDVVIVGSDQVWNPQYLRYSDYAYLIPFRLKNTRKIAYAASFGIDNPDSISSNLLNTYKVWLRDFDAISVREQSDISWLSKLVGKEIVHTLDPTLLFYKDWWGTHALSPSGCLLDNNTDYVFVYNLTYDMVKLLEPFLDKLRKKDFTIFAYYMPRPFPLKPGIEEIKHLVRLRNKIDVTFVEYIDPFEFLWLIRNARYIITNSYHGTIFSILFEKNFIVIPPREKSKRILDLLDLLGLEKRAIRAYGNMDKLLQILMEEITYDLVIEELKFHRRRSLDFLSLALLGRQHA
jgi:polysaccharide pyruvyl transferase WcaK-like protein